MLIENQNPHNKSLMVALLGRPNAGKSTLINHMLGFDLSIVSAKPQTTRNHFHCAMNIDQTEIVFVDTPGVHKSSKELNLRMNGQAQSGANGADLNLILVDVTAKNLVQDVLSLVKDFDANLGSSWLVFTKSDLAKLTMNNLEEVFTELKKEIPALDRYFLISAKNDEGIHLLTGALLDIAIPGPHLYPNGDVSNKNMRFFAAEYIREQAFSLLKDELPYETAVVIEDYRDPYKDDKVKFDTKISASILVNRPSQRAIVVGRQGSVIKQIGTSARKKIEAMIGDKVHLNLHVKVAPRWFKNNFVLDELDLPRTKNSHRVWRKK